MCRFKSGIVTKDGRVIAPVGVDSHCDIFDDADVEDNGKNAVPVECYPDDMADFFKPAKYVLHMDCDIRPRWFTTTRWRDAEQQMRKVIRRMIRAKHIVTDASLWLRELTKLPKDMTFEAEDVSLRGLKRLPEGTRLKVDYLQLDDLRAIAKGVRIQAKEIRWQGRWYPPKELRGLVAAAAKRGD